VTTAGSGTETLVRQGTSIDDLWLIAARKGAGMRTVKFKGLPRWTHRGSVYTENRSITASTGSFSDRFAQWDVHVYHFVEPLILKKVAPGKAKIGSRVTLQGKGLAAAKGVSFGGAKARFKIVNDGKLVATVPAEAQSGPIVVTSPLKHVQTRAAFPILPSATTLPRITGTVRVGHRLEATRGVWNGDSPTRYKFQWLACNRHGSNCRPIPGATRRTLHLGPSERGERLRILVTAHAGSGTSSARSALTTVVSG
jgi:hypothetical protein